MNESLPMKEIMQIVLTSTMLQALPLLWKGLFVGTGVLGANENGSIGEGGSKRDSNPYRGREGTMNHRLPILQLFYSPDPYQVTVCLY